MDQISHNYYLVQDLFGVAYVEKRRKVYASYLQNASDRFSIDVFPYFCEVFMSKKKKSRAVVLSTYQYRTSLFVKVSPALFPLTRCTTMTLFLLHHECLTFAIERHHELFPPVTPVCNPTFFLDRSCREVCSSFFVDRSGRYGHILTAYLHYVKL